MDRDQLGSVDVRCDAKAHAFLAKQDLHAFVLDVEHVEEACVQIYNPVLRVMTEHQANFISLVQTEEITLYSTPKFNELFSLPPTIELTVEGLIRKHLIVKNIDPIIKNVCNLPV